MKVVDDLNGLALVTLDAPGGGPDLGRLPPFVARAARGVTYARGPWHHFVSALDRPGALAVLMWRDGTASDEELDPVPAPLTVEVPDTRPAGPPAGSERSPTPCQFLIPET